MRTRSVLKVTALLLVLACHQTIAAPMDDATAAFEAGRYAEAKALLEPLAASGTTTAKRMLGEMYYAGKGVPQNKATAVKWTLSAAADEDRLAEFSMGYLHEHGDGVAKSARDAADFYRKSALQRYVPAMVKLADLLVYSDPQSARYWYKTASEYGDDGARAKFAKLGEADAAASSAQSQKWDVEHKAECASACPINAERTRCELKMMEPSMCSDNVSPPIEVQVNVASTKNGGGGVDPRVLRGVPNINPGLPGMARGISGALPRAGNPPPQVAQAMTSRQAPGRDNERVAPTVQSQTTSTPVQAPPAIAAARPPTSSPAPAAAPSTKSEQLAPERYVCNKHETFLTSARGKLTKEQACDSATQKASAFANALGSGTMATQILGGADLRKLQSVESCRFSDGDAVVRVSYSDVERNPCGSAATGISR